MRTKVPAVAFLVWLFLGFQATAADARNVAYNLDIPAQDLNAALQQLAIASQHKLFYKSELVEGKTSQALKGEYTTDQALKILLNGTDLTYDITPSAVVLIRDKQSPPIASGTSNPFPGTGGGDALRRGEGKGAAGPFRLARAQGEEQKSSVEGGGKDQPSSSTELEEIDLNGIPEILVSGSRALNMDIRRTENDAQPYVIFDREVIEKSAASNVEDFLKQRLTVNTQRLSNSQSIGTEGTRSQISLRGLGIDETLILIDGRRIAGDITPNGPQQPNINGIPLAAIERIEVLSATASGIYGGSATGGVVNIILRRDYRGVEFTSAYDNSFQGDPSAHRVGFSAGFDLHDGKTNVLLAGNYSDTQPLLYGDRTLLQRAREHILANNPSGILLFGVFPPLGATPNIMSADGSSLFGPGTPSFTSVPENYAGGGGIAPLQANAGRFNLDLANTAQSDGGRSLLQAGSRVESGSLTVRHRFSDVEAFLDLAASQTTTRARYNGAFSSYFISAAAPNNPFGQDIFVTVPVREADELLPTMQADRKVSTGVIFKMPHSWHGEMDYVWSRAKYDWMLPNGLDGSEAGPIFDGTLDVLRDVSAFPLGLTNLLAHFRSEPVRSTLQNTSLRVAGPLGRLPGGSPTLSGSLDYRDETFAAFRAFSPFGDFFTPEKSQDVRSAYLEFKTPLVSSQNAVRGVKELELQVAGRWDEYRIDAASASVLEGSPIERARKNLSSVNPTVGLRYVPISGFMLRASYGTGYRPPGVDQLVRAPGPLGTGVFPTCNGVNDPLRGEAVVVDCILGGSVDLDSEESESWSTGFVLSPAVMPDLRLSVDYTRIEKTGNIVQPLLQDIVSNEDIYPGRVIRDTPAPGEEFGVITIVDGSFLNLSQTKVEAYDFSLDYRLETPRYGNFDFFALATWQTDFEIQRISTEPFVQRVGIGTDPVELQGNVGVTWRRGPWMATWNARYFDSYRVNTADVDPIGILNQGNGGLVPHQSYHDLGGSYTFSSGIPGLASVKEAELGFTVRNLFNKKPPVEVQSSSFAYYSLLGDPRLASYQVSLRVAF